MNRKVWLLLFAVTGFLLTKQPAWAQINNARLTEFIGGGRQGEQGREGGIFSYKKGNYSSRLRYVPPFRQGSRGREKRAEPSSMGAQIDRQASPAASYSKQEDVSNLLNQIKAERLNRFSRSHNSMSQITSVNQLRDVQPTDWAYEALRSLVEGYGCLVGYPNRTYRGNRALSRYEFAAGLNACMQQMERLIAQSAAVLREDLEKLQRLIKEFETELANLGARVDNLEGRVAFLEDHQFSTRTFSGERAKNSAKPSSWVDKTAESYIS